MHPQRVAIRFPGTHDGFATAFDQLRDALDAGELCGTPRFNTELVFEEMVANIINHGVDGARELTVAVTLETRADTIVLTFEDDGIAFDPRDHKPVPLRSLDEERNGGFGLVLVRHAARSVDYERTALGHNRVTITLARAEVA